MPAEPPPTSLVFPPPALADGDGCVAIGGDLAPGTLLAAYRSGLFPMSFAGVLTWWSPDPRAVLPLDALHVSRRLARSRRRFEIRVDTAFGDVVDACRVRPPGEGEWLTKEIRDAYVELHRLGWAHSVEAWTRGSEDEGSRLVGGLYGVAIGGLFAGESMFHRRTDASKAALVGLVELLRGDGDQGAGRLLDVQWRTPHLGSLGVVEIPRDDYLDRLGLALRLPSPFRDEPPR